jgi:hypothetical protein
MKCISLTASKPRLHALFVAGMLSGDPVFDEFLEFFCFFEYLVGLGFADRIGTIVIDTISFTPTGFEIIS